MILYVDQSQPILLHLADKQAENSNWDAEKGIKDFLADLERNKVRLDH